MPDISFAKLDGWGVQVGSEEDSKSRRAEKGSQERRQYSEDRSCDQIVRERVSAKCATDKDVDEVGGLHHRVGIIHSADTERIVCGHGLCSGCESCWGEPRVWTSKRTCGQSDPGSSSGQDFVWKSVEVS